MDQIYIYIIVVVFGGILVFFLYRKFRKKEEKEKLKEIWVKKRKFKKENQKKILKFMEENEVVKNSDIKNYFLIAESTATRYLEELEQEGKIRQVGDTGRSVFYEKI